MAKCSECQFFNYEEYWDGEDEYGFFHCEKDHIDHISWDAEPCEDFSTIKFIIKEKS